MSKGTSNGFKLQKRTSPCLEIPPSPFMKRLGLGTGVEVYLVERSPKQGFHRSPWAVKKINKRCCGDKKTYMRRLKDEAAILRDLTHSNIVGFRGFMERDNGDCVLVMEDGEKSLLSMVEERSDQDMGPFPSNSIFLTALQVAQALAYLHHDKLLLHGDIKSANVLVKVRFIGLPPPSVSVTISESQGDFASVKLCDFGVTLQLDENLVAPDGSSQYVGTEPWSAQEVLRGHEISNKADIYSYGMLIFEMLTLSVPHMHVFPDETDFDTSEEFEKAWAEAEDAYQCSLGGQPPLLDFDYDHSYNSVIELFCVCSQAFPSPRPSAIQIVQLLKSLDDVALADPKQKLIF